MMVRKTLYQATSRLVTLPQSHTLDKHVSSTSSRYVRSHRVPIYKILHAFNVQPAKFESITPCSHSSKCHPSFTVHIPTSKDVAVEAVNNSHSKVKVYSDGSGHDSQIGAGMVLDGVKQAALRKHLGSEEHHTVFEAEVLGMSLAAELVRVERHMHLVTIGVDSQATILTTKHINATLGQYLVDVFHEQLTAVCCKHAMIDIELRWPLGHAGISGNEWADKRPREWLVATHLCAGNYQFGAERCSWSAGQPHGRVRRSMLSQRNGLRAHLDVNSCIMLTPPRHQQGSGRSH